MKRPYETTLKTANSSYKRSCEKGSQWHEALQPYGNFDGQGSCPPLVLAHDILCFTHSHAFCCPFLLHPPNSKRDLAACCSPQFGLHRFGMTSLTSCSGSPCMPRIRRSSTEVYSRSLGCWLPGTLVEGPSGDTVEYDLLGLRARKRFVQRVAQPS